MFFLNKNIRLGYRQSFRTWRYLVVLFSFFSVNISAQNNIQLKISPLDRDTFFLKKNIEYENSFPDTSFIFSELKNIISQLHNQSFFEASFDSTELKDSIFFAPLHIGEKYEWAVLKNKNIPENYLDRAGFRERLYNKQPFNYFELNKLKENIVEQAENNGYPFAAVRLDDIFFEKNKIRADIFLDKGQLYFFDSLNIKGDVKIRETYLRNYLGIHEAEPYNRAKVLKIRSRLQELQFLKEKSNATVSFLGDKASVNLNLEKKRASRFDALIGVLPDNNRIDPSGGEAPNLIITGTFDLEMENQFGLGERVYFSFERLRPQTQEIELAFAYPYVLDLPFGVDLKFSQYKRDSSYTDIIGDFGVQYLFEGGNYLKAFWKTTASNLINVDTTTIKNGRLPDRLDVSNSAFGVEANWNKLDYRFNPRRGWSVLASASAGNRKIQRNQAILNVDESFYDSLPARSYRFNFEGHIKRFFAVGQRGAVMLGARSGAIISEEPIYQNEQYRIGGNRILRGFDEEGIFSTFYSIFTLEYRLLVGQNSYFYIFGDQGYTEDRRIGISTKYDRPLGLGGGLTFETSAGVFGISIAAGKTSGVPFDFRNPKIHFGYVSIF